MFKRWLPALLFTAGAIWFVVFITSHPLWQSAQKIASVMRLVHEYYVDPDLVSYEQLTEHALEGMLRGLDPYSAYLPVKDFQYLDELTRQSYVGIGIQIERLGERVTVIEVYAGGAAALAGIRPGDEFLRIADEDATDLTVRQASERLRGPEGTTVDVVLYRPVSEVEVPHTLTRRSIQLESVRDTQLLEGNVGYMHLIQFGERTQEEFLAALGQLEQQDMQALIIDLRDNPGGLLETAKSVAGVFVPRGEIIVYTQGRDEKSGAVYYSEQDRGAPDYPVVLLINAVSASGAEILAGTWQDYGIATLIGETTHGKGSVQSLYRLEDGDGVRQTTALYYTPSGKVIHKVGVKPDIEVSMDQDVAQQLILQKRHGDFLDADRFEELFDFQPDLEDPVLQRALEFLQD